MTHHSLREIFAHKISDLVLWVKTARIGTLDDAAGEVAKVNGRADHGPQTLCAFSATPSRTGLHLGLEL
jgi:hypothetical protein